MPTRSSLLPCGPRRWPVIEVSVYPNREPHSRHESDAGDRGRSLHPGVGVRNRRLRAILRICQREVLRSNRGAAPATPPRSRQPGSRVAGRRQCLRSGLVSPSIRNRRVLRTADRRATDCQTTSPHLPNLNHGDRTKNNHSQGEDGQHRVSFTTRDDQRFACNPTPIIRRQKYDRGDRCHLAVQYDRAESVRRYASPLNCLPGLPK